ncbi:bifunctional metallophosphatase/5'-nucleotidase [Haliea sp. E17]|uniref:bifunctional metallophosphatase/5'-nucleotidase n=1 Tax=Haliea sp. E17 TaxID=3401576 RepID=UPI003AABE7E1
MKLNISALSLPAVASLSLALLAAPSQAGGDGYLKGVAHSGKGRLLEVQILGFNDYHGHIKTDAVGFGVTEGGGEYLAAKLAELRAGKKFSVTVAAGDLIGGSPAFSGLFHDEPAVESLNAMGLDLSGVGNHEFDEGVDELLRMQNGGCHPLDGCYFPDTPFSGADFRWLSANVVSDVDGASTPLPAYWIEKFQGVKVGFIGMTLEGTADIVAAAGIQGWDFVDEAETANNLVPLLKAQGVEAIVVLLHEGGNQQPSPGNYNACEDFVGPVAAINAALDPEIDLMITGHTHQPYNCRLPDAAGNDRIVTSAYQYGRVVTEVTLVLDRKTGDVDRERSSAFNHAVVRDELLADAGVSAVIEKWQPLYDSFANEIVGSVTEDINRGPDRATESAAGNLVADAQLWATRDFGSQIAFMNPGGVRSDLVYAQSDSEGDGNVTFGEAFSFQPFNNGLEVLTMNGAQIVSVLEEQCQPAGQDRPFLHLGVSSGFSYDLFKVIENGNCVDVAITNVALNGIPLDMGADYLVAVNSFLADGGDQFFTFPEASNRISWGLDLDALTSFLGEFSPVAPPPTDRVNELN